MKTSILLFFVFLIFLSACNGNKISDDGNVEPDPLASEEKNNVTEEDPRKFLVTDTTAGPFRIGHMLPGPATMMKYQVRVEQKTRYTEEGNVNESVTIIAQNNEDLIWLKPGLLTGSSNEVYHINEIIVISPKYKTPEGIGVGSSIADFQTTYPDYRVWYTYVSDMFVLESDSVNVQFLLDNDDYQGPELEIESEIMPVLTSDFHPESTIRRIRIINLRS